MGHKENSLLYNADAATFFYPELVGEQGTGREYSVETIEEWVERFADAGIDTLLVNANTQVAWYPSDTIPTLYTLGRESDGVPFEDLDAAGSERAGETHPNYEATFDTEQQAKMYGSIAHLAEQGIDWLDVTLQACEREEIEPWVSVRMNDMHGVYNPEIDFLRSPLIEDPENRLSGETIIPSTEPDPYQQALDYEQLAVRKYIFALIEELIEGYDFAGIELDWLRNPRCCEPPATERTVETMLDWMEGVRALADDQPGAYPVGLRIPPDVRFLREIGLDVPAMTERGLVDFVAPSNFWQTTWALPYDRLRDQLADDVAVYGVIENAPNFVPGYAPDEETRGIRLIGASPELLRGNTAGKLATGVDGIELFNFFCTDVIGARRGLSDVRSDYNAVAGLDDPETLAGRPKQYALSTWVPVEERIFEGEGDADHTQPYNLTEQLPAVIEPETRREFRLTMAAEPDDADLTVQVVIDSEASPAEPPVGISVNGSWPIFECERTDELLAPVGPYTHHVPEHLVYEYTLPVARIEDGWNDVVVYNASDGHEMRERRTDNSIRVTSLELAVGRS